jgi:penicillin-binding protein-related factor A (putative recombinase)
MKWSSNTVSKIFGFLLVMLLKLQTTFFAIDRKKVIKFANIDEKPLSSLSMCVLGF